MKTLKLLNFAHNQWVAGDGSLAEWCAVLDTLIAVGILVLVWT